MDMTKNVEDQLTGIIERNQISDLHVRYFRAIDDKQLNSVIVASAFTMNAVIIKPNGAVSTGHEEILQGQIKSFARFQATQHTLSDFIIEIDNNAATIKANLIAMHVWGEIAENPLLKGKHFHAGGVLLTKAVKLNERWYISEWIFRNVWRNGEGMQEMAKFARPE